MKNYVINGREVLGIELGSTRIKAVLIDENCNPVATGSHTWENRFENGFWTYHMDDVWSGIQDAYLKLNEQVYKKYGTKIKKLSAIGFSAMRAYTAF